MTQQDYEQKKRECWEEYWKPRKAYRHGDAAEMVHYDAFSYAFDRAYSLGKQERDAEEMKLDGKVTISLHVAVIPRQEEFYMGVDASHEAYTIDIPKSIIPSDLLAAINGECKNKLVTNIAIMK